MRSYIDTKWSNAVHFIKRVYRYVNKIIYYSIYLWNDYDFDDIYIFSILKLKLTRMADFFESDRAMAVGSEKLAKEMRLCISLIDRIEKDEYADLPLDQLERKYGKINWEFKPVPDSDYFELDIHRNALKGTLNYESERKEASKI